MKEKLSVVFIMLLLGAVIVIASLNAYSILWNPSRQQELNLLSIYGGIDYSHKLEGIIPLGTDHYWLGADANTEKIYYVRASKKWFDNNFPDGDAKDGNGIKVTGFKTKVTDSELKRAMDKHVSDAGIPLLLRGSTGGEFLLLNATGIGIFSLAIAACGLLCGVFGVVVVVKKDSLPSLFKTIYGCFVVVWALALAFYFTRYGILV